MTVGFADIVAASKRLHGVAHRTPVLTSKTLDSVTGAQVFLKAENFQRMGAFKFRGAYNRLVQLTVEERARGVVAFSSGNHAQGVALAAKLLNMPAKIVMPADAPPAKVEATRGYGAEVVFYDRHTGDREAIARDLCDGTGAALLPPYDDVHVIAGQGTAGLELLEEVANLNILVAPVGGGGLLSGVALAAHGVTPKTSVYGVEPETGNDFERSLAAGQRVKIDVPKTIADGQQTQSPGELTFPIVQRYAKGIVTVTDDNIKDAMRFAFARLKLVVEPSGATGLAAVLAKKIDVRDYRVGIIISGGNADPKLFAEILSETG